MRFSENPELSRLFNRGLLCLILACLGMGCGSRSADHGAISANQRPNASAASVYDLDGRVFDPFQEKGAAIVFIFVSNDCPISNRYAPEVKRLHEKFHPKGVVFWLVHPH